jgi:penicillin amidase
MNIDRTVFEAAVPDMVRPVRISGLDAQIVIYRDRWGIPHVEAQTLHDAFFGQGFATAQDRLWHMDLDRRRARGRSAELLGEAAIAQDVTMRRFRIGPSVESDVAALNGETRGMLEAYAAGVNAFLETTERLPVEYGLVAEEKDARQLIEPWRPSDSLAVFKVRHILMGVFEAKLWRARLVARLGPEKTAELVRGYQPGHLLIVPPGTEYDGPLLDGLEELSRHLDALQGLRDGVGAGSNSWALSGERTASGLPLLAGDPHRALDVPNVYYQNHIRCPEFDAIGLSFPGCPGFPHFGHNAQAAWCVTHAGADYQDLYLERFRQVGGALRYEYRGRWLPADVRHEVISARGDGRTELDVVSTRHGPVIAGDPARGHGVAFRYSATAEPNVGLQCLPRMLAAKSADELEEAMRDWVDPCNNFLFADAHGTIGYLNRGRVPVRPMANAWLPVPGWTGDYEWRGFIPFDELVRSRNPKTGYLVTANNRIAGRDYPHYIALDYAPDYRARRIVERVRDMRGAAVEDMAAIHGERLSFPGAIYSLLLAALEPADEASREALARLAGWQGEMDPASVGPTIYSAFRLRLHEIVLEHLLGAETAAAMLSDPGRGAAAHLAQIASRLATMAERNDTSWLPPGTSWSEACARALAEGVRRLSERYGEDMTGWTWGRVHHTHPTHPLSRVLPDRAGLLDPPRAPAGGDGDTPQAASYRAAEPFLVSSTSVARYVFDTADWENSRWIVPLGASGHPGSRHYADQMAAWADLLLIPMLYGWTRIREHAESRQELLPG